MAKTYGSSFYRHLSVMIKRYDFSYNYKDSNHLAHVTFDNEG